MKLDSICVYCGSSNKADKKFIDLATELGTLIAENGKRLVYGGGNVGLMGASSRAAYENGGRVLGIMPHFLTKWELPHPEIETIMVDTMHERKWLLFAESDGFAVLPGGIGTLEEVVETLSWHRLQLHQKPIVFVDKAFWQPFVDLVDQFFAHHFVPDGFESSFCVVDTAAEVIPAMQKMLDAQKTKEIYGVVP
ncbi:TIGR00730 family Rossman fold protein [Pseudaquidulcibacter saccharophilus]|uniref:LOG family protein n=1 Tax=Pseudaquidulcibacter saccharophilus TaxID=2831900 RepID=UPI001EFF153D|nr:TIGR00730 family Rossman fold protein [Pseudaquidulcibacter saccharophilus]